MPLRDLCNDKKFPNLEDDLFITYDKKGRMSFIDEKNNVWIEDKKIEEGGYGKVISFKSHNKEYCDLAIKFFMGETVQDFLQNMNEETSMVNFFNLHKCKNFLKVEIRELSQTERIVVMEKVDGDMYDFDFKKHEHPLEIYRNIVNFILSGYECALRKDKYYMDMKEENLGYKFCEDGIRFTFLDFGSFSDIDNDNYVTTFSINIKNFDRGYFSNEMILVYGTIITLLNLRLSIKNKKSVDRFRGTVYYLMEIENYPKTNLLVEEFYDLIYREYMKLFKTEDDFVDFLFRYLHSMTEKEPDIKNFLNRCKFYLPSR